MRRMLLLMSAVVAVASCAVLAGCGGGGTSGGKTEEAGPSLPAGEIVFTRSLKSGGRPSLYVMESDGSQARLLVRNADDAAVSADGSRIAFVRDGAIWIMREDGSGKRQVTHLYGSDPAWSPDGHTLYFAREVEADTSSSIFSIRADGSHLIRLTRAKGSYDAQHPNWYRQENPVPSPDGRLIAFEDTPDWFSQWHTIRAVSPLGRLQRLPFRLPAGDPETNNGAYAPAWSPDSRKLAYCRSESHPDGLRYGLYASESGNSRPHLLGLDSSCSDPAWSPDGEWIAYAHGGGISAIRPDGSDRRPVARRTSEAPIGRRPGAPSWSPDGRWIALSHGGRISIVRTDGTGLRRFTDGTPADSSPAWLPSVR